MPRHFVLAQVGHRNAVSCGKFLLTEAEPEAQHAETPPHVRALKPGNADVEILRIVRISRNRDRSLFVHSHYSDEQKST